MPIGGKQSRSWVWIFIGTTPRLQSLLKKLKPSVPVLSRRPKMSALWPSRRLKPICSAAIREAETWGASQAESLHRWHAEVIKHLEEQVTQEEGKSQIDFLSTCQAALNASPGEFRGALVASYHILMGQVPSSHPFSLSQGASPTKQPSASAVPPVLATEHSPRPKRWLPSPDPVDSMPPGQNHIQGNCRRAP